MSVAAEVEKFVVEEIAVGRGIDSIAHDEDLLASDILDSLGIMELVAFLEEKEGIRVTDDDLTPENFQTVDSIVVFVERKKG